MGQRLFHPSDLNGLNDSKAYFIFVGLVFKKDYTIYVVRVNILQSGK